ncbi:MAG: MoaD/ThiS family protein [Candidatus Thalassarchaeaceae archaeon]|nr:MoaD/ThiS family protein [Candidatus Thalassarchaeaceae archaeon]|tara:strand:- start:1495 stop:1764 length:270 start_codon:yes stop_codon:yes gene_type:complete
MEGPSHPGGHAIVVSVLFFGPLAESLGEREAEIALDSKTTVRGLIKRLGLDELVSKGLRVALDGKISSDFDIQLSDSSEVAFLPPVSGG